MVLQLERQLACSHCPVPAAVAAEVAAAAVAAADSSSLWAVLLAEQLLRLGANWRAPHCRSLRDVPRAPAPWQQAVS